MKSKIISIQLLRALACLLVLQQHLLPRIPFTRLIFNGAIGVDLFFVISGYIIAASISFLPNDKPSLRFLVNRFSRVAPYYYLFTIITTGILIINGFSVTTEQFLNSIFFIPQIEDAVMVVGWSLNHEILFYSFVAISLPFVYNNHWKIAFLFLALILTSQLMPNSMYLFKFIGSSMNLTFLMGFITYRERDRIIPLFRHPLLVIVAATSFLIVPIIGKDITYSFINEGLIKINDYPRDMIFIRRLNMIVPRFLFWGIPSLLLFASALAHESYLQKFKNTYLVKIGDASYSVYLLHGTYLWVFWHSYLFEFTILRYLVLSATVIIAVKLLQLENLIGNNSKNILKKLLGLKEKEIIIKRMHNSESI